MDALISTSTSSTDVSSSHEYSAYTIDAGLTLGDTTWSSHAINPYTVLQDLIHSLQTNRVPGPLLVRSVQEYNDNLGQGAYSEVRAANSEFLERYNHARKNGTFRGGSLAPNVIAIKRHRSRQNEPKSRQEAQSFLAKHFADARTEVKVLCHPKLRNHRNIVKLQAWGLCLDALEDNLAELNIPLLVLEKAEGDLSSLLQRDKGSSTPLIQNSYRVSLCLDIGHGLEALHDLDLAHGDLKPANILIFVRPDGLVAKLCDFGTAIETNLRQEGLRASTRYRGTPGWRAPEVLQSDQAVDALSCDIYAYGLVIWSMFVGHGKSCLLTEAMEKSPQVRHQARVSMEKHVCSLRPAKASESDRIVRTLCQCLHYEPPLRNRRPWEALRTSSILTHVKNKYDNAVPSQNTLAPLRFGLTSAIQGWLSTLRPWAQFLAQFLRSSQHLTAEAKVMGYKKFIENLKLRDRLVSDSDGVPLDIANSLKLFDHGDDSCLVLDLPDFTISQSAVDYFPLEEKWYYFARCRSRFRLCCFQKIPRSRRNFVAIYLHRKFKVNFHTLAWLCRGRVGEAEVAKVVPRPNCALFDTSYTESQRLAFMLLLLSKGFRIETQLQDLLPRSIRSFGQTWLYAESCTVLEYFLQNFRDAAAGTVMRILCEKFSALRTSPLIAPTTLRFMLGEVQSSDGEPSVFVGTTALHVSASRLNYEAVESLLRIGANPDVQNRGGGWNTFDCVCNAQITNDQQRLSQARLKQLLLSRREKTAVVPSRTSLDGTLLGGSMPSEQTPLLCDDFAHGWSHITIYDDITANSIVIRCGLVFVRALFHVTRLVSASAGQSWLRRPRDSVFRELFTGSFTFQRPLFCLLQNGNIALGYRKLQDYRLDLIAFLTPQTPEKTKQSLRTRFPVIDDEWYRREPFVEEMTDDPLAELRNTWFTGFNELRLLSLPVARQAEKVTIFAWSMVICVYLVIFLFITAASQSWFGPLDMD